MMQLNGVFKIRLVVFGILFLSLTGISWAETPSFQGLGDLTGGAFLSIATNVSADGSTVVGWSEPSPGNREAFRWTASGKIQGLGELPGGTIYDFFSEAHGVSADGSVVGGISEGASGYEAFKWTESGDMQGMGPSGGSGVLDISADGTVMVGGYSGAFRWTESGGMTSLDGIEATGVSADGLVVVGCTLGPSGIEAFRWESDIMTDLGLLPGGLHSRAEGVSADGLTVVGTCEVTPFNKAFRWTESEQMQELCNGEAYDVSGDGSFVVGVGQLSSGFEAFIWDRQNGAQSIRALLVNDFGLNLSGWNLFAATGVSDDGLTIVGYGQNPAGYTEAWAATIPEPATLLLLGFGILPLAYRRRQYFWSK
jgi:probable HAF family extracellular repeat protein